MQREQKKFVAHPSSSPAPRVLEELNQHGNAAAVGSVRVIAFLKISFASPLAANMLMISGEISTQR
jgi:hypothetical protein